MREHDLRCPMCTHEKFEAMIDHNGDRRVFCLGCDGKFKMSDLVTDENMNSIRQLREQLEAGTFFVKDGEVLKLLDIPTGGPLFHQLDDGSSGLNEVQMEVDEFDPEEWTQVEVDDTNGTIEISFESSGADHKFTFERFNGQAWLDHWVQGGETYSGMLDDVSDFAVTILECQYGLEVTEG